MSFLTINESNLQEIIKQNGGKFIGESGIYDVTIKCIVVTTNTFGARNLNLLIDYDGNSQILWGLKLDNNNGEENFQRNIFAKLAIILGLSDVDNPVKSKTDSEPYFEYAKQVKTATGEILDEVLALTQFEDIKCKIRVQRVWSKYNGNIKRKIEIRNFFAENGADAYELVNNTEVGVQLAKEEKYAKNDMYQSGVTESEVEEFLASKGAKSVSNKNETKQELSNPFIK